MRAFRIACVILFACMLKLACSQPVSSANRPTQSNWQKEFFPGFQLLPKDSDAKPERLENPDEDHCIKLNTFRNV